MRRLFAPIVLVVLVGLAGCAGPFAGPATEGEMTDPAGDPVGWEGGYWHDESLAVTAGDGLNDSELDAVVARTTARVEVVRDVEFERSVPVTVVSRSEYQQRTGDREVDDALRAFDDAKMEALLLVGEDEDAIAVQDRNRGVSVGGYYSPGRDEIVVVSDGETATLDETTLAHELMHAWQDRRFDLSGFHARTRDARNGENGIVEGDANYVQHRYRQRCGGTWTCVTPEQSGGGQLANYGIYVLKYHPYSDGPSFVAARLREGGWDAVDAVYEDPPASAEQVTHPDRYGTDPPTDVALRDRTTDAWSRVRPPDRPDYGTVGQAGVMATFVYPLYHSGGEQSVVPADAWFNRTDDGLSRFDPLNYDHPYAAGWDGDRLHVYENDANESAYVWRLVWDSPRDAREFYGGYRQTLAYWGAERVGEDTYRIDEGPFADAFRVVVDGDTVTVVNAPTVDGLSTVRTTIDADDSGPTPVTVSPTASPATVPGFGALAAVAALLAAVVGLARRPAG